MQSPTAQDLNASTKTERARERERESHLCKSVRKIFSVLQDCWLLQLCGSVVWERQSFRLFNFFFRIEIRTKCIGMKIREFFLFYLLR